MRNKTKSYKHLPPHPSLIPRLSFNPISLPPSPERRRGTGNWGCGQFTTCCLCRSFLLRGGLLTLCPCSSLGSLTRGAVLQQQAAPAWVPHRATGPARSLLQCGLPTGSQTPLGIHLLRRGVLHGLQVKIFSTMHLQTSMGCRAKACLTIVCSTGCRGISAPMPAAPPPPPSALTLESEELFLSHSLNPAAIAIMLFFFP